MYAIVYELVMHSGGGGEERKERVMGGKERVRGGENNDERKVEERDWYYPSLSLVLFILSYHTVNLPFRFVERRTLEMCLSCVWDCCGLRTLFSRLLGTVLCTASHVRVSNEIRGLYDSCIVTIVTKLYQIDTACLVPLEPYQNVFFTRSFSFSKLKQHCCEATLVFFFLPFDVCACKPCSGYVFIHCTVSSTRGEEEGGKLPLQAVLASSPRDDCIITS